MRVTLEAVTVASPPPQHICNLPESLSRTAQRLYEVLREAAAEVASARGHHPAVSVVHFFAPSEAVALALGVHRVTVWRALRQLREIGLVDCRGHYCTHRGQTRSDGSVWAVRMNPGDGGEARIPYDALKAHYRDLGGDIEQGRTVWAQMQRSKALEGQSDVGVRAIAAWALPWHSENPITFDCCSKARPDLEAVLDVPFAPRAGRSEAVDTAARGMAAALGDHRSVNFYRMLLWALLRLETATGRAPWYFVYEQARRARVDAAEGFARRPGALFISRLKAAPWWEELRRCPAYRVGAPPG